MKELDGKDKKRRRKHSDDERDDTEDSKGVKNRLKKKKFKHK